MKANEFVKKFGSKSAKYWIDHFNNVNTLPDEFINTEFLGDLKRLVESHEFINERGGLEHVKNLIATKLHWFDVDAIIKTNQAIADVESCQ